MNVKDIKNVVGILKLLTTIKDEVYKEKKILQPNSATLLKKFVAWKRCKLQSYKIVILSSKFYYTYREY